MESMTSVPVQEGGRRRKVRFDLLPWQSRYRNTKTQQNDTVKTTVAKRKRNKRDNSEEDC